MEYVLKIYSNQNSSNPFNTVENLTNIDFNWDLNDFSVMKIDLAINISGLSQFNKIELCTSSDGEDIVEFGGYIYNIRPSNGKISLECRDFKSLLLKKLLLSDYNFSGVTVSSAMGQIISNWKTETDEDWTFSTDYTGTFTKKFSEGDNWADVLDEIGELTGCVRKVDGNNIIFNEIIGVDKSIPANSNFFEFVYNGEDLTENNIDTIDIETYSTLSNFVIGKDATGKVSLKDNDSITALGVFAEFKTFREGSLSEQTQKYLDIKKNEQKVYKITGKKNVGDDISIGDKIHLRIENLNEYMNIETDVFVLEKQVRIENGTKIINLTLSNIYAYIDTFTKKIIKIQKSINLLSL